MPSPRDDAPHTLLDVLRRTESWLRGRGVDKPRLEAELLLGHVLGVERLRLYLMFDRPMVDTELEALRPLVKRRGQREPLAYLTGTRGFHSIDLRCRPGVLIPRPDTETLVDAALEWIGLPEGPVYVADVGTGTGAVGLAIAQAQPLVKVYATDLSPVAIALAKENAAALGLQDRFAVLRGSYLDPIPAHRPIDWLVSNPPYIPSRDIPTLQPEVALHEPHLALDGGRDGLDAYHALLPAARARVRLGALFEVGHDQATDVSALMREAGFVDVRTWRDLAGIERVVGGRQPSP